jgi:DNA-binding protein YbaB
MGTGDTDTLPEQLTSIQSDQANLNASAAYTTIWTDLSEDLVKVVQDGTGKDIIDLQTSPELAEVRTMWTDAHNRKDERGLRAAMTEAEKVMRLVERGTRTASPATSEDSGAFDLDTGPAAGGSGMSDQRWLDTVYGSEEYTPTSADHKKAKSILDRISAGG